MSEQASQTQTGEGTEPVGTRVEAPEAEAPEAPEAEAPEAPEAEAPEAPEAEAPAAQAESADGMQWFALQVYLGHENKVKNLLQKRYLELRDPAIHLGEVLVPTQEVVEIKGGKKTKITRNLYPGYILVEMRPNEETLHFVNNVHGVIKFLGAGKAPQPLRPREINKILGKMEEVKEAPEIIEIPFDPGDSVEVTDGPFSDFNGTVEEVYPEKGKVKVTVSLFGRPTSVELDYLQLKKI
jgi:transcriptional antiterminator NusG